MARAGFRLIRLYIRRHPRPFALSITGATLFALATVGWSWAIGNVVDKAIEPSFTSSPPSRSTVAWTLALLCAVGLTRAASVVLRRSFAGSWQHNNSATLRLSVLDRLIKQPMSWMRRQHTGDLLAAANDAETAVAVLAPLPYSMGVVVLLAVAGVWLVWTDLILGAVALIVLPLIGVVNTVFQRKVDGPSRLVQQAVADLSNEVSETVDGIGVVKALGLQVRQHDRAAQRIGELQRAKTHQVRLRVGFDTLLDLIPATVNVGLILLGAWRVQRGAITVGNVVAVVNLFTLLVWPLRLVAWALAELPRSIAGLERVEAITNSPIEQAPVMRAPDDAHYVVELTDVSVVHSDGRVALDHVSLRLPMGRRVAVVGPTGSGKSTLLGLIAGVDVATSGEVRRARGDVALVFQEPMLFAGSIVDNIALGRELQPHLTSAALKVAQVDTFIDTLSDGTATRLGERGVTLSGGQRQRVALARALVRQPSLLLLDDTTSSLDPATEAAVLTALADPAVARSVVMVASRPSTIAAADEIVVLDNGSVVGQGTHEELLSTVAVYRELVNAYSTDAMGELDAGHAAADAS
jgi:ATP-binding cassette, subfamily B, bacterial